MILRLDTNKTFEESILIFESLTYEEREFLESLDFDAYDDEIEGKITSFVVIDEKHLDAVYSFMYDKEIKFNITDLTEDVLVGKINFNGTAIEKSVKKFIKKNLTTDHVLDKINHFGVNSLNSYEKKLLKNI